jgi:6-phosphofructokinase
MKREKRIAILTGGGDCPGLNAVIRAVTKKAIYEKGLEVIGIQDGYEGMVKNRYRKLKYNDVSGILALGGTILGTLIDTRSRKARRLKSKTSLILPCKW